MTVDAQVHVWEAGAAGPSRDPAGAGVSGAQTLRLLDASGVARAILVSPGSIYGFDSSFALGVAGGFPDRLRVVGPVDLAAPLDAALAFVERWAADPLTVGLRVVVRDARDAAVATSAAVGPVLARAAGLDLPVNVWAPGHAAAVGELARAHPSLRLVVDHTGIAFAPGGSSIEERLATEGAVVASLSALDNVVVKLTGVPALSAEPYPFRDLWPWAGRLLDAFGPSRVMWGTDWTRVNCSYPEGLGWFLESGLVAGADAEQVLTGTAAAVYHWP